MKTSELTGAALDWAVAKCEGKVVNDAHKGYEGLIKGMWGAAKLRYSTNWAQGGPIIERELINVIYMQGSQHWMSTLFQPTLDTTPRSEGPTPLIAAMRCYVASKLGDEVEIPHELTKGESK